MAKRRRIMRDFVINEISAVDRPAQGHARMTLMKRADPPGDKHDLAGAIAKRYLNPEEGASSFDVQLRDKLSQQRYWAVCEAIHPYICALEQSLKSIAADPSIDDITKMSLMRTVANAFLDDISARWPDVKAALAKSLEEANDVISKGEDPMSDAAKKQLDELSKANVKLTADLEKAQAALKAATEGSTDAQKAAELQGKVDDLTKQLAELTAKLAKAEMSDDERAYMETLDKEGQDHFMAMTNDERKAAAREFVEQDEVVKVGDTTIRKSVVGESQFAVIKAQQAELTKTRERLDAAEAEARRATLAKRAEDELSYFPGTVEEKSAVLDAIDKMDEAAREALSKMLSAGQKATKAAFGAMGVVGGRQPADVHKRASDFEKRVSEIKANEKVTGQEAMKRARDRYPEEFEAYQSTAH